MRRCQYIHARFVEHGTNIVPLSRALFPRIQRYGGNRSPERYIPSGTLRGRGNDDDTPDRTLVMMKNNTPPEAFTLQRRVSTNPTGLRMARLSPVNQFSSKGETPEETALGR